MSLKPFVKAFYEKSSGTISYVVQDPSSKNCAVIDSVLNFDFSSGRTSTISCAITPNWIPSLLIGIALGLVPSANSV